MRYNYVYDNNGRVTRTKVYNLSDSINYIYSSENTYDEDSKISEQTREYFYGNTVAHEAYTYVYDTRDRLTRVRRNESEYTSYSYDALSRVYSVSQSYFGNSSQIQYYYGYATVNSKSTNRVSSFMTTLYSSSSMTNTSYSYTYDEVGRITEIRINGTLTYSYEYDNLGQLVRENNLPANATYMYVYDNAGNRVYRYTYAYTTGATTSSPSTDVYYYNNSNWGDLLTSANGVNISYDAIGNPTAIGNVSLTWQGRRLVQYGNYTYTYNADGIRTSKTVNGVTHNYILEGSTILAETYNGTTLRFVYDNTGVIGLYYNGTLYMYEKNLQGDVVAILNSSLTRVVEYYYDAWGNIISTTGSLASTLGVANPIRYRSYYYDTETDWYYLQSRYYNPVWGRFINADNYVNANGDLIGFNMFAYCSNNPVMFVDPCGLCAKAWAAGYQGPCPGQGLPGCMDNWPQFQENSIIVSVIDPKSPPDHPGYTPPKKFRGEKVKNPNGPGRGWPAKDGGVWMPSPKMDGGEGWIIQYPDGSHSHAYPGGGVRNHFELEQPVGESIIAIFAGVAATIYLVANDVTGFGVADDPLIAGSVACFVGGFNELFGKKVCTVCGEVKYGH